MPPNEELCPIVMDKKLYPYLKESDRRCQYPMTRIFMDNKRESCHQDGKCIAATKYPQATQVESSYYTIISVISRTPKKRAILT